MSVPALYLVYIPKRPKRLNVTVKLLSSAIEELSCYLLSDILKVGYKVVFTTKLALVF